MSDDDEKHIIIIQYTVHFQINTNLEDLDNKIIDNKITMNIELMPYFTQASV